MLRVICISDTHGRHDHVRLPVGGDILIHAGDFTGEGLGREHFCAFLQWFERQKCPHKILISGNHDGQTEKWPDLAAALIKEFAPSATYLQDSETTVLGLRIWGSPVTPTFFDWYHMRDRGAAIRAHWDKIPAGIDVLVTHGPPQGVLDWSDFGKTNAGCADLLEAVKRVKPKMHVFGHLHLQGGEMTEMVHEDGAKTICINAATCDENYNPVRKPRVIDLQ